MICLIYAHPYPNRSRANRILLDAVSSLPEVDVRRLYDLYPDFGIDVAVEQEALARASVIVWQHPLYWYSVPGLMKHWFDKVLALHWAYGPGGTALAGKTCLWVTTTGAPESGYAEDGMHRRAFGEFVPVVEQTARFCSMRWAEPLVLFGAHKVEARAIDAFAARYRECLQALAREAVRP